MDFRKHAFILAIIEALRKHNSWCGKTHIPKCLFLVQELTQANVPFQFVLYKHGPYSFDLESTIEEMKSYDGVTIQPVSGMGVIVGAGDNADFVRGRHALNERELRMIEEVANLVSNKNVAQLERIATAVWVRRRQKLDSEAEIAHRVHQLKPHISPNEAKAAYAEVKKAFPQT